MDGSWMVLVPHLHLISRLPEEVKPTEPSLGRPQDMGCWRIWLRYPPILGSGTPNSGLRYPQFWWFVEDMAQEHCNVPGRCNRSKFFSSFCTFFYIFKYVLNCFNRIVKIPRFAFSIVFSYFPMPGHCAERSSKRCQARRVLEFGGTEFGGSRWSPP